MRGRLHAEWLSIPLIDVRRESVGFLRIIDLYNQRDEMTDQFPCSLGYNLRGLHEPNSPSYERRLTAENLLKGNELRLTVCQLLHISAYTAWLMDQFSQVAGKLNL